MEEGGRPRPEIWLEVDQSSLSRPGKTHCYREFLLMPFSFLVILNEYIPLVRTETSFFFFWLNSSVGRLLQLREDSKQYGRDTKRNEGRNAIRFTGRIEGDAIDIQ